MTQQEASKPTTKQLDYLRHLALQVGFKDSEGLVMDDTYDQQVDRIILQVIHDRYDQGIKSLEDLTRQEVSDIISDLKTIN